VRPGCEAARHVPQVRAERDRLRIAMREHLEHHHLEAPLSTAALAECAVAVLTAAGADVAAYRKWAMVTLNTESWRPRLAAIPPAHRLLLLPQCLRREGECPAVIDELGLVCQGCGRCPIATFRQEAEALGYVTLISEGTAAVLAIIRTGRIAGFVGVSCLSTLEKVYPFMALLSVPALAFPLVTDGCCRTTCDEDLVVEAIRLTVPVA
jgi:hypothetical protein